MQCPLCNEVTLVMAEQQGVEVDYCPRCRGLWLDRGELDKIIERSVLATRAPQGSHEAQDYVANGQRNHPRGRNRGGFLEDLLDFG